MDLSPDSGSKPMIGMEFDSLDDVWMFWVQYGGKLGFGVRKHYYNKNKNTGRITSYKYVCCKEGVRTKDKRDSVILNPRLETRKNCKARLGVTYVDGKYKVNEFNEEHNHPLHLPETTHMLSSKRKVTEVQAYAIDLAKDTGLQQKSNFDLMAKQAGGRDSLGFTALDAKNYLRSKRQRSMKYGEIGCLMQYFQQQLSKNPSFYHANQMDMEEHITNVFWADAKMLIDFDVVSLDTTYCTNGAHKRLAIFSGFNHHRTTVIFGAALLYDETAASFKWLFETFLEAHKQKKPLTIFTDQDQAMAKALREVMPETFHRLCTWHLNQNGIKHLGNLMKEGSCFLTDFKRCMYNFDDEAQFEKAWNILLKQYNLEGNAWLMHVYSIKEKWAICFMKKAFTLGMRSTQLSESINSDVKKCTRPNLNIPQFFKSFERVLEEKRYKELQCEFEARQKLPRLRLVNSLMLQQLSKIYTPTVFELFQKEFDLFVAVYIKYKNETEPIFEYVIGLADHDREWRVIYDPNMKIISCCRRRFEMIGLLCCHVVKVYEVNDVKILPEYYILKRWTTEARSGVVQDYLGNEVEEDHSLQITSRYRKLCLMLVRLATEASIYPSTFSLVHDAVCDLSKKVMAIRLTEGQENSSGDISPSVQSLMSSKGFKKKISVRGSKRRLKSWVELQSKQKESNIRVKDLGAQSEHITYSPPPTCLQMTRNQFNFTELLTALLDHPLYSSGGIDLIRATSNANSQVVEILQLL